MAKNKTLMWLVGILALVGGLNWLLIGLFEYNLVQAIFGGWAWLTRTLYVLAGAAGVWVAFKTFK